MKKIISIVLLAALCLCLAACGSAPIAVSCGKSTGSMPSTRAAVLGVVDNISVRADWLTESSLRKLKGFSELLYALTSKSTQRR